MDKLEKILAEYLVKKAPSIPTKLKKFIVKVAPWLVIVSVLLSLPSLLALFGWGGVMGGMMWRYGYGYRSTYMLAMLVLGVSLVLEGLAIPGLLKMKKNGWQLMFYSILVSTVYSLLMGSWGGLIVGTLISLYVLFQVKEYYK